MTTAANEDENASEARFGESGEHGGATTATTAAWRSGFLRSVLASAFLLFFQAYMVAPLIPFLARAFGVSRAGIGLIVPAYLLPYALGTFVYGFFADRFGRRVVLFACLPLFAVCCLLTATAHSVGALLLWRVVTGAAGSGIAVAALTLLGDLYAPEERGEALGWLFGAIAGGGAAGSTVGGLLYPLVGWRGLFLALGAATLLLSVCLVPFWRPLGALPRPGTSGASFGQILRGYRELLLSVRGGRTYLYIFLNGVFHSGVFTWLGAYLSDRYHLSEAGIGLALLGYGVPGFLFGPVIGRIVDRQGRGRLIPIGVGVAAVSGLALLPSVSLPVAMAAITTLSLGFDMSHPLLAGIVSTLAPEKRGQAMGLNTFTLFLGLAVGSLVFGAGMRHGGFAPVMGVFAGTQIVLALLAVPLFQGEGPAKPAATARA